MNKKISVLALGGLGLILLGCQPPTENQEKAEKNQLSYGASVVPWVEVPQPVLTAVNLSIDHNGTLYRVEDIYRQDYGANQVSVWNPYPAPGYWTIVNMAAYEMATCSNGSGVFAIGGGNNIYWNWGISNPPFWYDADKGLKVACHGNNAFRVSMDPAWGTYALDKFNTGNRTWTRITGAASKIALGAGSGEMWVIAQNNQIWSYNLVTQAWTPRPGAGRDVAVTNQGVYVLGTVANPEGNYEIYRWTGSFWQRVLGTAEKLYSGGSFLYSITKNRRIWKHANPPNV